MVLVKEILAFILILTLITFSANHLKTLKISYIKDTLRSRKKSAS
jgi:hypothetical protein